MNPRWLFLAPLILVFLAGCEPSRPSVFVSFKSEARSTDKCMSPDDVTVREGVIHIKCKKTDNGQYAFCATGPVCNKGDTYEYTERRDATMTPEEFTFKYEHDKAFRDSVSSYSFR